MDMKASARLSPCGRFRHTLERIWGTGGRIALFCMLNPSTADHVIPDPTLDRVIAFAKSWGYDGVRIVNLCSFRATYPEDMYWFVDVCELDHQIAADLLLLRTEARREDVAIVVCAWGKVKKSMAQRAMTAHGILRSERETYAIHLNKDGSPGHPLYLSGALKPIPFELRN